MSTTTSETLRRHPLAGADRAGQWRFVRHLWALAFVVAALVGGNEVLKAARSPGDAIRHELVAAAAELTAPLGSSATDAATRAIRRHFRAHAATLHTEYWPQVSVTLHHLDRTTCVDARSAAGRIEGLVVIELKRYRSGEDCVDDNDMTWQIWP
jgi:hypothetical protein